MSIIKVANLKKYYKVHKKEPGFINSIKSLVARKYYSVRAVDDISFSIDEGELVGFIGPNGAGKTTTLKCLSGLLYPDGGEISVLGFTPFDRKKEFLKQISLIMGQKNQLWWDLPALDSLILNKHIYEIPNKQFKRTLSELSELLDLTDLLKVQVRKLSLGQRMRAELIAALIYEPKVLFLDEPTIGLDVVMQKRIRDFIKEYNKRKNTTIILTSHYMGDVQKLCKRVIIIDAGKIVYDGLLDKIVAKYADHKLITIILERRVDKKAIDNVGKVKEYNFPRVSYFVKRKTIRDFAVKVLQKLPVADLNIQDPAIEDIIREIFTGKDSA